MAKMTKEQAKQHRKAEELVALKRDLTEEEREFVLDHWQEDSTGKLDGAFFTPADLAREIHWEVYGDRVIDLCAGIGRLAWGCRDLCRRANGEPERTFVCVERNPAYVRVGRKVLPEAHWICGDVFDLPPGLGRFDTAISNPPFMLRRSGNGPRYQGGRFEYHVIDVAGTLADRGVFIIPQTSAPMEISYGKGHVRRNNPGLEQFTRQTGIKLRPMRPWIDTSAYDGWRGAAPRVELVAATFRGLDYATDEVFGADTRELV